MEFLRTKKSVFCLLFGFLTVFVSWILLSVIETGQAQNNLIDKETIRLQVNYFSHK